MEILLLGPVRLRAAAGFIELGSDKERALLAALAVDAGRPVSLETLITRLWDNAPPVHARESVHSYVSRLRKRLTAPDPAPAPDRDPAPAPDRDPGLAPDPDHDRPAIVARAHTYLLRCDESRVDWHRFRRLVATRPADDDTAALAALRDADELWVGEPLAGLSGTWAAGTRRTMTEQRRRAGLLRITAMLRLGEFAEAAGELAVLADQRPADETVQGLLMVAYHGSQRSAEALHVHQRLRQTLTVEYGTRPGREIDRVHRGILDRVPALDLIHHTPGRARAARVAPRNAQPVVPPRNLPHQPPLIGRSGEMRLLTESSGVTATDPTVISLETVTGMAGVGKTALAVHTAGRLAARYPDGQLYLNFRTHADQAPVTPGEAVATLLRLLGADASQISADPDEQTALWHHMLGERRVVLVLDDIADAAQVTPLLPQTNSSLAIMTSRRHVAGIPHARRIRLDVLPAPDAIALFRRFAGKERTTDLRLVRRIVDLCGHLPLAIELVASRFHTRASWTLTNLVRHLSTPGRLAEIRDPEHSLASAFALSYRALDDQQRRAFRLLALHPGADFTADVAAAVLDLPAGRTEGLLEELLACHLISEPVPERFQYHDLLREYARTLTGRDGRDGRDGGPGWDGGGAAAGERGGGDPDREAALHRMTVFYARTAAAAALSAYPQRLRPFAEPRLSPQQPAYEIEFADGSAYDFEDAEAAKAWLEAERQNLLAAFDQALTGTDADRAAGLGYNLSGFLGAECHWREAEAVLRRTASAWTRADRDRPRGLALLALADVQTRTSQYTESAQNISAVLAYARAAHDKPVEAEALLVQGLRQWRGGELDPAMASYEAALALSTETGDMLQRARITNNIAVVTLFQGRHDKAMELFQAALSGFAQTDDELSSARILNNIGDLFLRKSELASAKQAFEDALSFLDRGGNRHDRAVARAGLADTLAEMGRLDESLGLYGDCLREFQSLGDPSGAAETLIGLAHAHQRLGNAAEAARCRADARALATRIGAAQLVEAAAEPTPQPPSATGQDT